MSKFQISTIQYFTYIARNYLLYLNQVIVKRKKSFVFRENRARRA